MPSFCILSQARLFGGLGLGESWGEGDCFLIANGSYSIRESDLSAMYYSLRLRSVTIVAIFVAFLLAAAVSIAANSPISSCSGPLKADFSTYWIASRWLLYGGDPFDPTEIKKYADSLGCTLTGPSYILPWLLIALFPLASLPLDIASVLWFLLNAWMVARVAIWSIRSYSSIELSRPVIALALVASPGVLLCLTFGQFGIACLWGMVLAAEFYRRGSRLLPLALIVGSLKPHIGWLYWILVARLLIQHRKFGVIIQTALIAATSATFVFLWVPGSYDSWTRVYGSGLSWMGASVATPIRVFASNAGDSAPIWPVVVIMFLAVTFSTYRLWRPASRIDLRAELPWLLALSICTSPYVWSLDFCVLLPAEIVALSSIRPTSEVHHATRLIAPLLVIIARIGLVVQILVQGGGWRTWWYPPIVLLAFFHHLWCEKSTTKVHE